MLRGIGVGAAATATAVGLGFALTSEDGLGNGPAYSLFTSVNHYKAARFGTSGILFKDTLEVNAFQDPKVEGITIYVSRVKRPMVDKVRHGLFQEPSSASVCAVRTGKPKLKYEIDRSQKGESVFSEMKNIISDSVEVRRIYDEKANTLLYVSYNNNLMTSAEEDQATTKASRYKTSISGVPLYDYELKIED